MDMTPKGPGGGGGDGDRYEIMLIAMNDRFWLARGEQHMTAMLSGEGEFPTPVAVMNFENHFKLRAFLPEGTDLGGMWQINPLIVVRLRENDQIVDLYPDV